MRIALIHALRDSIAPIQAAFTRLWPEAELMNLLDDSLSVDRLSAGQLSEEIIQRFLALGRYAQAAGADGILFTCSAFGPAIDAVACDLAPMVVHKPNTAAIGAALRCGKQIGLLASFGPTLNSMIAEFPPGYRVTPHHCQGALAALEAGDVATHDTVVATAARAAFQHCDCILLAQFSLARAEALVLAATGKPVISTPEWAVRGLRLAVEAHFGCHS